MQTAWTNRQDKIEGYNAMDLIMVMGCTATNLVFIYFEFAKDLGCGKMVSMKLVFFLL